MERPAERGSWSSMTATDRAVELVHAAARAASDKLATNLLAFDVSEQLAITDAFLLCTASAESCSCFCCLPTPSCAALPELVEVKPPTPDSEIACPYLMFSAVFSPLSAFCFAAASGCSSTEVSAWPSWPPDFLWGTVSVCSLSYLGEGMGCQFFAKGFLGMCFCEVIRTGSARRQSRCPSG